MPQFYLLLISFHCMLEYKKESKAKVEPSCIKIINLNFKVSLSLCETIGSMAVSTSAIIPQERFRRQQQ